MAITVTVKAMQTKAERNAKWARENPERKRASTALYRRANPELTRAKGMVHLSKRRAAERGFDWCGDTMSISEIVSALSDNPTCACCGKRMIVDTGVKRHPLTPSIDKVINERGYVKGNVAIVCWRCNEVKGDATLDELRAVIAYMERHS